MSTQTHTTRLARNFAANLSHIAVALLVSFFLAPFVVQKLGATGYGVWTLVTGLLSYLALLDLGIRQAVNRYVAHYRTVGDHKECSIIVSTALNLLIKISIIGILLSAILAYLAPLLFNIPEAFLQTTRTIVVLGGCTIALSLVSGVFGGVVTGLQRFDITSGIDILIAVVRATGVVIVLSSGYGLIALACVHFGASVLNFLIYKIVSSAQYRELSFSSRHSETSQNRMVLSFAAAVFAIHILEILSFSSDVFIIGIILPIESVTFYAIAANLVFQTKGLSGALANLMTPRISTLASQGSEQIGDQIIVVAKYAMLLIGPVAVTFILRGESFVGLWMGFEYATISGSVLGVLSIVLWQNASRSVFITSLVGLGRQRILIPGLMAEAASNIMISVALIRPYGVIGVAIGTLIPSVIVGFGYVPHCLHKVAKIPKIILYRNVFLLPVLSCMPFALGTALIEHLFPAKNLVTFFVQVIIVLPLAPAAAWILCFSQSEKRHISAKITKIFRG